MLGFAAVAAAVVLAVAEDGAEAAAAVEERSTARVEVDAAVASREVVATVAEVTQVDAAAAAGMS
jgi:hypothetical protein